jgi:protein SCO1/2
MNEFFKKHWYKLTMAAVSVVLLIAIGFVYFGGEKEPPLPVVGPAEPFTLTNVDGEPVTMETNLGQVKLVYFFFANCPDVCPPTSHMLSRVQDRLVEAGVFGEQAAFYQITVDPENDTLDVLRDYAEMLNADLSGWHFLRGSLEETKRIADGYGVFFQKDPNTGLVIHSNIVTLVDGENQIRKYYMGDELDDELIANDILRLIGS